MGSPTDRPYAAPRSARFVGSLLSNLLPGLVSLALVFATVPVAMAETVKEAAAEPAPTAMQSALDQQLEQLPSGDEGVATIMGELVSRLTLTDAQQREIEPIVRDAVAQMEGVRDRYRAGEISALMLGMQLQMSGQKAAAKVEPHLTPEQATEYATMRQEQRRAMLDAIQRAGAGSAAPPSAGAQ